MSTNEKLLAAVNARQEKRTEFGYGILTADKYVRTVQECVGISSCYKYFSKGALSFNDVLHKAAKTLVYGNTDMVLEDVYTKNAVKEHELELPKNTLMAFRHVLTTPRKDRDGDILRTEGAQLDPKMPLLWQHIPTLPIGKMLGVVEHTEQKLSLISVIIDMNELSHDAAVMVDSEMGRFSHGFKATEFEEMEKDGDFFGFDIKQFEIMEESLVSIPSNVDAETEDVILGLVEEKKLTSSLMKEYGRTIREKLPARVAVKFRERMGDYERTLEAPNAADFNQVFKTVGDSHEDKSGDRIVKGTGQAAEKTGTCSSPSEKANDPKTAKAERKEDVARPQVKQLELAKHFDVDQEYLEASKLEYEWASRWIGCQIKQMREVTALIPTFRMGSFLTGMKASMSSWEIADVRNITYSGREEPPRYEMVQLNSTTSDTFLTDGLLFVRTETGEKLCVKYTRAWNGVYVKTYAKGFDTPSKLMSKSWEWAVENNFLKGEAFSLTGDFIQRGDQSFDDVFLPEKNIKAVSGISSLLNDKGKDMANRGMIFMGPPGCLHADTPIYDPLDGSTRTVSEREEQGDGFHVYAKDNDGNVVIAEAESPWKYDPAEMVQITFASGRKITVTKGHRFWAGDQMQTDQDGYVSAGELASRSKHVDVPVVLPSVSLDVLRLLGSADDRLLSNWDNSPLTRDVNEKHCLQTDADWMGDCSNDLHPHDAQLHAVPKGAQSFAPSQDGAQQHSHEKSQEDDPVDTCSGSHLQLKHRLSKQDYLDLAAAHPVSGDESHVRQDIDELSSCCNEGSCESRQGTFPLGTAVYNDQPFENSIGCANPSALLEAPVKVLGTPDYMLDRIVRIEDAGTHPYYDFHVPEHNNYWAEGTFHHNTGKTLSGRILMNETKATLIWVSAKDFWEMGAIGGFLSAFELAKELSPCILFVEDIDNWMSDRAVDVIKTEMDGLSQSKGVLTIMTTNYPERLPDALIDRPGRFHDVLRFDLPDDSVRAQMLTAWAGELPKTSLERLTKDTEGFSGAHIYELVYFAKVLSEDEELSMDKALEAAIDKINEQRELIDQSQLAGSNYKPRKESVPQRSFKLSWAKSVDTASLVNETKHTVDIKEAMGIVFSRASAEERKHVIAVLAALERQEKSNHIVTEYNSLIGAVQ